MATKYTFHTKLLHKKYIILNGHITFLRILFKVNKLERLCISYYFHETKRPILLKIYPNFVGHERALLLELELAVPAVGGLPAEQEEDDAEGDTHVDQDDQAEQRVGHHGKSA